jgi:glycerophosphoryl diester phosphodiesterase
LGVRHIETDARATADGVAVLIHDATVDRVTTRRGAIAGMPWSLLSSSPLRNGDPVPSLADMLHRFPNLLWNIDVKCDDAVLPVLGAIGAAQAWDRVAIASFSGRRLRRIRALAGPRLTTAATFAEVTRLRLGLTVGLGNPAAAQVPTRAANVELVTGSFIRRAHAAGIAVHVWTINEPIEMARLLDLGVDGLVTDRPDLALELLG